MKKMLIAIALLLVGIYAGYQLGSGSVGESKPMPVGALTPAPEGPGWIDLLSAEHVSGWTNTSDDTEIFEIEDGVLHIYGVTITPLRYVGYMKEQFGDFDLHLEFKVAPGANSGLFLRKPPGNPDIRGFEVQVLDDHGQQPTKNTSGSIYDNTTAMYNMSFPPGEWNSYDISVHGQAVSITMNGWKVVETDFSKMTMPIGKFETPYAEYPQQGIIALQDHGGEAWYRNILIKPATRIAEPPVMYEAAE